MGSKEEGDGGTEGESAGDEVEEAEGEDNRYRAGLYFDGKPKIEPEDFASTHAHLLSSLEVRMRCDRLPLPHMNRAVAVHQMNQALLFARDPEKVTEQSQIVR